MKLRQTKTFWLMLAACLAMALWLAERPVLAHPLTQGAMDVVISRSGILLRARISIEEVIVSNSIRKDERSTTLQDASRNHGLYMLQHVFVKADGKPLNGRLVSVRGEDQSSDVNIVNYEIAFDWEGNAAPREIAISQDVMNEVEYAPGNRWEASYLTQIGYSENDFKSPSLLTSQRALKFQCDWKTKKAGGDSSGLFSQYLLLGVGHIIGHPGKNGWENIGFDHLLFVTALVIAARNFWDLLKLVSAFTLAHTLTLALSVLDVLRLPGRIVEPMIALSIIFVAVENIWRPERTQRWVRLASAFFFGLFHGLCFAGGLMSAGGAMQGASALIGILAFSIGVECGHQLVVMPIFAILKFTRNRSIDETRQRKFSAATLKYGSVLISIAGIFYLIVALGWLNS
jgi:hypothetical protein